ncbi:chaperone (heat shock protein) [Escherichia coli]|nr:chaperone (heat shock protein) [Escherichia coli]
MTGGVRSIISKYSDHIALPVEIEKREEKDGENRYLLGKNQQSAGAVDS